MSRLLPGARHPAAVLPGYTDTLVDRFLDQDQPGRERTGGRLRQPHRGRLMTRSIPW